MNSSAGRAWNDGAARSAARDRRARRSDGGEGGAQRAGRGAACGGEQTAGNERGYESAAERRELAGVASSEAGGRRSGSALRARG